MTDITFVNPVLVSQVSKASAEEGAAIAQRRKKKFKRYTKLAQERDAQFTPLVFETAGRMGPGVLRFARALATSTASESAMSVPQIMEIFCVTRIKGNAHVAHATMTAARKAQHRRRSAAQKQRIQVV